MKVAGLFKRWLLVVVPVLAAACIETVVVAPGEPAPLTQDKSKVRNLWVSTDDAGIQYFSAIDVFDDSAFLIAGHEPSSPGNEDIVSSRLTWYSPSGEVDRVIHIEGRSTGVHALANKEVVVAVVDENYDGVYDFIRTNSTADTVWSIRLPARLSCDEEGWPGEMNASYVFDVAPKGSLVVYGLFSGELVLGEGETNETILDAGAAGALAGFLAVFGDDGSLTTAVMVDSVFDPKRLVVGPDGIIYVVGASDEVKVLAFRLDENLPLLFGNIDGTPTKSPVSPMSVGGFVMNDSSLVLAGVFAGTAIFPNTAGRYPTLIGPVQKQRDSVTLSGWTCFVARYLPGGELNYAFLEYDGELENRPTFSISEYPSYDPTATLLNGETILVAGLLFGTVTFGNGETNEVTLSEDDAPYFIAAYNLDGTLAFAEHLYVPVGLAGLAVTPDGAIITVSDGIDFGGGEHLVINRFTLSGI